LWGFLKKNLMNKKNRPAFGRFFDFLFSLFLAYFTLTRSNAYGSSAISTRTTIIIRAISEREYIIVSFLGI
jgi:hypothetical protein